MQYIDPLQTAAAVVLRFMSQCPLFHLKVTQRYNIFQNQAKNIYN